jgi:hypothetical protein
MIFYSWSEPHAGTHGARSVHEIDTLPRHGQHLRALRHSKLMVLRGMAAKSAKRARELGQVSVLAALMIGTTFFLFLAFVTNTGMVVHAKINLQNAADVAAYAGAATQARQMNHIAILNYEMRRQFKKFLVRYYVLGASAGINQQVAPGPVPWGPNASHNVPAVCIVYRRDDNFCQLVNLPEIAIPGTVGFLDSIGQALRQVLQNIEQLRQANCEEIGLTNILALYLWLFNTEAQTSTLLSNLANTSTDLTIPSTLQAVTRGLGLVPKNLLLKKRIDSLQGFVNYPPAKDMTLEKIESFEETGDFFARERTLNAFYSAYRTLGPKLFDDATIFMDEILPSGTRMLELEPVFAEFDTYAVQPEFDAAARGCVQRYFHIPITGRTLPVAVFKRPNSRNVHYAVRLRAKARVLLSPFGEIEMTAYAAAKPFGSRIGPELTADAWARNGGPGQTFLPHSTQPNPQLVQKIPNLSMLDPSVEAGNARGQGFDNGANYTPLLNASRDTSSGSPTLTLQSVDRGIRTAMAPLQAERGRYVIPVDLPTGNSTLPDGDKEYFSYYSEIGDFLAGAPSPSTAFYAPIRDRESPSLDPAQEIDDILQAVQLPQRLAPARVTISNGLRAYFGLLRAQVTRDTDELESFHFARVSNPLKTTFDTDIGANGGGGPFLMLDPNSLRSSWGGQSLAPSRTRGRVGYSVKLVSFSSLVSQGLAIDPDTESVLDFIQH